jgi:ribosomal protein S27AE
MIARYNKRIKELESRPDEMYQYMIKASEFIRIYDEDKNKGDLFKRYLFEVEGEGTGPDRVEDNSTFCTMCKGPNVFLDICKSDQVCEDCGYAEFVQTAERSYKEEQETPQNIVYSYKKENHFNEWISQFQGREQTSIPPEVYDQLRVEFKKQKIKQSDVSHSTVRTLLKKLKLNKYYEHVPHISSFLSGKKPPTMSSELEEKLRLMFCKIQKPFENNCPEDRKNFLSYSYILYKFCELLSEDSFLPCFPLLKSKEKLYKQDQIWKKICEDLQWEFIPTV